MDRIELADAVYVRLFPATIVLCTIVGAASFALQDFRQAIVAFLAIGLAVKLNDVIERRRDARAEHLAGLGWTRARSPRGV